MTNPYTPGAGDREGGEPLAKTLGGAARRGSYYNEFDPFAAQWLRNLISAGHIAQGVVDDRPIQQVQPGDIPARAHFFAGIGGWDLALQLAGWPDERPVWTGSCPCQPFSAAGKRKGVEDPRHLWPEFRRLIAECRPPVVFGEQVASADGRLWLSGVRSDLEALGYAVGAADLCSAGVGAPNIRQRLYWVARAISHRRDQQCRGSGQEEGEEQNQWEWRDQSLHGSHIGGLAVSDRTGQSAMGWESRPSEARDYAGRGRQVGRMEHPCRELVGARGNISGGLGEAPKSKGGEGACAVQRSTAYPGGQGYWDAFDILPCLDGKARRIEPGSFPLAHGVPGRVGLLRGYGNAINPWVAAEFIRAFLEAEGLPEASSPKGPLPATPEVTP